MDYTQVPRYFIFYIFHYFGNMEYLKSSMEKISKFSNTAVTFWLAMKYFTLVYKKLAIYIYILLQFLIFPMTYKLCIFLHLLFSVGTGVTELCPLAKRKWCKNNSTAKKLEWSSARREMKKSQNKSSFLGWHQHFLKLKHLCKRYFTLERER